MGKDKSLQKSLASHVSGQANKPLSKPAHSLTHDAVVEKIGANTVDGLSQQEAKIRLDEYGANDLGNESGVNPGKILAKQVANAMTLVSFDGKLALRIDRILTNYVVKVLILAMAVSFGIQSRIEGGVIEGVIALNVTVGFFQEYNAEKTMDSLRSLGSPSANAVRGGATETIPTIQVVPGDMIEVKTDDTVPADLRWVLIFPKRR